MYFVGGPLMYKTTSSYTFKGTLSSGGILGCGDDRGNFNEVSDWVDWIKKEMEERGEKAYGKSCKNGEQGLGNHDDGGGDNDLDNGGDSVGNPDQNGGVSVSNPNQFGGHGFGNQNPFGDIW